MLKWKTESDGKIIPFLAKLPDKVGHSMPETDNTCPAVAVELSPPCPELLHGLQLTPGLVASPRPDLEN